MTTNPCRLCAPLGAVLVFKGFRGMMPILHGSQGCATYIRRYLISHFREPVDVGSSSFTEQTAIFGGKQQLLTAIENIRQRYAPEVIGIASTCLSETIGDDVSLFLRDLQSDDLPVVTVSTPSYNGSHVLGFKESCAAILQRFLACSPRDDVGRVENAGSSGGKARSHSGGADRSDAASLTGSVNRMLMVPAMVSPADLRHLRELAESFGVELVLAPDYSDTLDGGSWNVYHPISPGGTPVLALATLRPGDPWVVLESAPGNFAALSPATAVCSDRLGGDAGTSLPYPVGIEATDRLVTFLEQRSGRPAPGWIESERARLLDSYADLHKYLGELRVAIVADGDLADGLVRLFSEVGADIRLVACPDEASGLAGRLEESGTEFVGEVDYGEIEEHLAGQNIDVIVASSKAYKAARALEVPLLRVGFPIHDRVGGARTLHLGYRGTQQLLDRVVNTVLEHRQAESAVGYTYL